jgi:hypothetical protein
VLLITVQSFEYFLEHHKTNSICMKRRHEGWMEEESGKWKKGGDRQEGECKEEEVNGRKKGEEGMGK